MPPALRSKVAEAVAAAAAGLANYLRLRADGARRIDTDDLSDDLFAELLHDGPRFGCFVSRSHSSSSDAGTKASTRR